MPESPGSSADSASDGVSSITRSRVGIGSPCGSRVGLPSLAAISVLELLGEDVLEHLGLGVHAVPRDPEASAR